MLLLLLACASDPAPERDPATDPPAYDVSDYAEDDRPIAAFDQAATEAALQAAIDGALASPAPPVLTGYQAALAWATDACPSLYETEGNLFWYDTCTTEAGARFDGYGTYIVYEGEDAYGDGVLYDGAVVYGLGRVTDPDGNVFEAGGAAGALEGTSDEGVTVFISVIEGGFAWDAPEAEDTWLSTDLSPSLTIYAAVLAAYDLHYVNLNGGLNGLSVVDEDAALLPTATFDNVTLADELVGFPCDQEPAGTIAVRDTTGAWFSVRFDVSEELQLTGACDGCGEVTLNGQVVGEACADFKSWLSWGDRPW